MSRFHRPYPPRPLRLCIGYFENREFGWDPTMCGTEFEVALITTDRFGTPTAKGKLYYIGHHTDWDRASANWRPAYLGAFSTIYDEETFYRVLVSVDVKQNSLSWAKEVVSKLVARRLIEEPSCELTNNREVVEETFGRYKELDYVPR